MEPPVLGVACSASGRPWRWRSAPLAPEATAGLEAPDLAAQLLIARGAALPDLPRLLRPTLRDWMPDPSAFRDMDRAAERIAALDGYRLAYGRPFFQEFVVRCPRPAREVIRRLWERRILPGVDMAIFGEDPHQLMIAVTEKRRKEEIDSLVAGLAEIA